MPFLWVHGSNDLAYTMNAWQQSYQLPTGPRTLCLRLRMPHGHGDAGENPEEIRVFTDSLLKQGAPLATITGSGSEGTTFWASYSAPIPLTKAELNVTLDTVKWQDRNWESVPAKVIGDRATANLPEGTRVYYLNLFDQRGCVVSTEHVELSL